MFGLSLQLNKTRPCAAPLCNERSLVCRRVPCISPSPGASKRFILRLLRQWQLRQSFSPPLFPSLYWQNSLRTLQLFLPIIPGKQLRATPDLLPFPPHLPSWESVPPSSSYKTHSYSYATHMTPNCTRGRHYREYWLFCTNERVLWFEYLNNCKHYEITLLPKNLRTHHVCNIFCLRCDPVQSPLKQESMITDCGNSLKMELKSFSHSPLLLPRHFG